MALTAVALRIAWYFATVLTHWFDEYLLELEAALGAEGAELLQLIRTAREITQGDIAAATLQTAIPLGKGVSGYIYHTVPMALAVWSRHPTDYRTAVEEMVRYGGDTDSTAAIVGGLVGAAVGEAGVPEGWISSLWEWPRGVTWMHRLAHRLAEVCGDGVQRNMLKASPLLIWLRNIRFLLVVLPHGFRRLFPPY